MSDDCVTYVTPAVFDALLRSLDDPPDTPLILPEATR